MCGSVSKPSRHITLAAVTLAAAKAVAEKPDGYTYTPPAGKGSTCYYNHKDNLRCIAGEVLTILGVPTPRYFEGDTVGSGCSMRPLNADEQKEKQMNSGAVDALAGWLREKHSVTLDDAALRFLGYAQRMQDSGRSWGWAVAFATYNTK